MIILASGSFLKKYIMDKSNIPYEVAPADIDETVYNHLGVSDRVVALSKDKCNLVAKRYPDKIVIAADTLTSDVNGVVFSKPAPSADLLDAAMNLSGQSINVYTGCCVYSPKNGYVDTLATGTITYQEFDKERLLAVARDDNPQIRSGALGVFVDAPGFTLIERIEGSYTGIYGLPMEFVYKQLILAK